MNLNYQELKFAMEKRGYAFFDRGEYNLNLFGIRSAAGLVNEFNDWLGVAYRDEWGNEQLQLFAGTTKPGGYYLKQGMLNAKGTAILIPGQYRGVWKLGRHKSYEALEQLSSANFKVWRDHDKDGQFDYEGPVYSDVSGLNLHTASFAKVSAKVGAYSAGCMVIQDPLDFKRLLLLVRKALRYYPNRFSFTLIEEEKKRRREEEDVKPCLRKLRQAGSPKEDEKLHQRPRAWLARDAEDAEDAKGTGRVTKERRCA